MRLAEKVLPDPGSNDYVNNTKGDRPVGEPEMLKRAMIAEKLDRLEKEAALCFTPSVKDRIAAEAHQRAARRKSPSD
jgi:hypothetical protein